MSHFKLVITSYLLKVFVISNKSEGFEQQDLHIVASESQEYPPGSLIASAIAGQFLSC